MHLSNRCKMEVKLIPFLLAANVVSNGTENLEHGWHAVYNITEVSSDYVAGHIDAELILSRSFLTCQNVEENKLRCIFEQEYDDVSNKAHTPWETFDITFDESGPINVTMSSSMSANKIRKLKRIVKLFSVGTDLTSSESSDNLLDGEMTAMGMCMTTFNVSCQTKEDDDSVKKAAKTFTLNPPPIEHGDDCAKVIIEKRRVPNSCCSVSGYFFDIKSNAYVTSLNYYHHKMSIAPKIGHFSSSEETEANAMVHNETLGYSISIVLEDILPGNRLLSAVENPATIDFII